MAVESGAGFNGKYELRLATGDVIVSVNDDVPGDGATTLFSLPYDESSITTTKATQAPLPTPTSLLSSSNVPTRSPPPGYVGKGWCLDAQDKRYKAINNVPGLKEVRSAHDCLEHCESIPASDPSHLVGFLFDTKATKLFSCLCQYTTLPDVTDELSAELGIVIMSTWFAGAGPIARSNDKDDSLHCYSTSPVSRKCRISCPRYVIFALTLNLPSVICSFHSRPDGF